MWRAGDMELCGVAMLWGGGGTVMRADGAVWHASSTRLRSAFSAVIKEMFMLWMMPRRGERRAQYSTLRYTTLSTPSLHPSIILFLTRSLFPFLVSIFPSPSLVLSLARCIFGSEWQFYTTPHCSTAMEWWQAPTPPTPTPPSFSTTWTSGKGYREM